MCVSDYRLGSLIRSVIRTFSVTSAQTFTIEANQERVGLTILARGASANGSPIISVDGNDGFVIGGSTYTFPWHITTQTHGDLPTHAFSGTGVNAVTPATGLIIEYLLPRSVIGAMLEEFRRQYPGVF